MKHKLFASLAVLALAAGAPAYAASDRNWSSTDDDTHKKPPPKAETAPVTPPARTEGRGAVNPDNSYATGGRNWHNSGSGADATDDTGRHRNRGGAAATGGAATGGADRSGRTGWDWRYRNGAGAADNGAADNTVRDRNRWRAGGNTAGGDNTWRDRNRTGDRGGDNNWRDRNRTGDRGGDTWRDRNRNEAWRNNDRWRDWREHDNDWWRNHRGSNSNWSFTWNNWNGNWGHWREHRNYGDWYLSYRGTRYADRRYHWGYYDRPSGWYYRRWSYGDYLPATFFGERYWIQSWYDFGLREPPPGMVWVRYGDDALLVDTDTGEIIRVVYNIFD